MLEIAIPLFRRFSKFVCLVFFCVAGGPLEFGTERPESPVAMPLHKTKFTVGTSYSLNCILLCLLLSC